MPVLLRDVFGAVSSATEPKIVGNSVTGLRIFRAGTFADSTGKRSRYTRADLDKMVENFDKLTTGGIFPHVPVREDHTRSIASVIGYFTALRRDGNFLVADIEFTEPPAVQKYANKTYRARSAEVGDYIDNDGTSYNPCILGVAFCDIPAVEGLYASQIQTYAASPAASAAPGVGKPTGANAKSGQDPNWRFDPMTGERIQPQDNSGNQGDALMKDVLLDLHNLKDLYAGDPDTESALQQIVDALTSVMQDSSDDQNDPADADSKSSAPQGGPGNPRSNHSGDSVAVIQFSLGGTTVEVDDTQREGITAIQAAFAAQEQRAAAAEAERATIAAERDTLATAVQTAEFSARDTKVDSWLTEGKITPAQVDGLKAFCRTLTGDQFTAQEALYGAATKLTFSAGVGTGAPAGPDGGEDKNLAIKNARAGYSMLKTTGVSGEKLANSKFAKDLTALGVDPEGK